MSQRQTSLDYAVDPQKVGACISPLLFGHNLEHTRSFMWRGLCAQLLRNRKFAGKPQQLNGVAMEWYPIGWPQTYFLLDGNVAYTRHYRADRRRHSEIHSQFIVISHNRLTIESADTIDRVSMGRNEMSTVMMVVGARESALQNGRRVALPLGGNLEADALEGERQKQKYGVDPMDVRPVSPSRS